MSRPLWVWLVVVISFFSGCGALVSGGTGLFTAAVPNLAISRFEKLREQASQLPSGGGDQLSQLQELDKLIARTTELTQNPLYNAQALLMAIVQLALGFGFLIGLVRLYRLQFSGVTILQIANVVAILSTIATYAVQHFTGLMPQFVPNEPGIQRFVIISSIFLSSLFYLLPLLLLTFCSKASFGSRS